MALTVAESWPLALSSFPPCSGSAISRAVFPETLMKRVFFTAAVLLAMVHGAFASANVDCAADDKNVAALIIEGITSRDGKYLASFRGELEIEPGKTIAFSRNDVKSFNWGNNIAIHIVKRTPQGPLEVRIYAKPAGDDGLDFEGTYVVRAPKQNKSGKVKCSGG